MNYIRNEIRGIHNTVEDAIHDSESLLYGKKQLDNLCRYYGSSYEGRRLAAMKFLHIKQMVPILISQEQSIIVFPTQGSEEISCIWINYTNLIHMKALDERKTLFIFQDEERLIVHMEYRSACIQVQRCSLFLYMLGCHRNMNILDVIHQNK